MTITETRRTTEFIVQIQVEETRLTLPTSTTLDIFLTLTNAGLWIARWRILKGATNITITLLTTLRTEIEKVRLATITFLAGDTWFTLAFAFGVALHGSGACVISCR